MGVLGTIACLYCIMEVGPTPSSSTRAIYIMDREVCPMSEGIFPWSHFHGLISKECILKVLGHLTGCKPNVGQEKLPYTQKVDVSISLMYVQKGQFWEFSSCLTSSPSSSPFFLVVMKDVCLAKTTLKLHYFAMVSCHLQ